MADKTNYNKIAKLLKEVIAASNSENTAYTISPDNNDAISITSDMTLTTRLKKSLEDNHIKTTSNDTTLTIDTKQRAFNEKLVKLYTERAATTILENLKTLASPEKILKEATDALKNAHKKLALEAKNATKSNGHAH